MKYLRFSILMSVLACSCSSEYKTLQPVKPNPDCIERIKPQGVVTSWYDAAVTVAGKHISGLLLVKEMPDQTKRVVFTNEAGVTFFDFEFGTTGAFQVKQIIRQLNKKPVVAVLRKDFELMLGLAFQNGDYQSWVDKDEIFYGVPQKKETAYFITDRDCASLRRIELGTKRKRKVTVGLYGGDIREPDSVQVKHHTFNMLINLKKLERH